MHDPEKIQELVAMLEDMRRRPAMYLGGTDIMTLTSVLWALRWAYEGFGYTFDRQTREAISLEHGWRYNASGDISSMREQGLDDIGVIDELIAIEIETWMRSYGLERQNSGPSLPAETG